MLLSTYLMLHLLPLQSSYLGRSTGFCPGSLLHVNFTEGCPAVRCKFRVWQPPESTSGRELTVRSVWSRFLFLELVQTCQSTVNNSRNTELIGTDTTHYFWQPLPCQSLRHRLRSVVPLRLDMGPDQGWSQVSALPGLQEWHPNPSTLVGCVLAI